MIYHTSFDSRTRTLALTGIDDEDESDVLVRKISVSISDSDGLLEGFRMYCVFDDGTRIEFVTDTIIMPDFNDKRSVFIQLCFEKDNMRFYSLDALMLRFRKAII